MIQRWLVIYQSTPVRQEGSGLLVQPTKAALIDDDSSDGSVTMPFGVEPEKVAEDCAKVLAIILCADPPNVPYVVIDDDTYNLDPADPEVDEEPIE